MLARFVLGAVTAGAVIVPALAGQMMNADEARKFVAGKVFAFTCFDGTRGAGRILDDMGAAGAVQFSGAGPVRHMRLPGNTLQVRGQAVCASIKGVPFEPCFNLDKKDERSFRGSVSGMGFRLLRFPSSGRSPDADGAGGGSSAFAASAGANRIGRGVRARRDPAGRERQDRAGQIRDAIGACEIGRRSGTAPFDRLIGARDFRSFHANRASIAPTFLAARPARVAAPACGTGCAGTASRSPPAPAPGT